MWHPAGEQADDAVEGEPREEQSGRRAERRDDKLLDHGLADDAGARGAERQAHGDFTAPADEPGEAEIGDVRARDQQDRDDGAHERREHRPYRAERVVEN
jgi:hypothetical protein